MTPHEIGERLHNYERLCRRLFHAACAGVENWPEYKIAKAHFSHLEPAAFVDRRKTTEEVPTQDPTKERSP